MTKLLFSNLLIIITLSSYAQSDYKDNIRQIYDEALTNGKSYGMLRDLTTDIGPRLSGSPGAAAAVKWG
ncbi:MAG: hypothetical protein WDN75_18350 [Bacteroidota bacterium]